MGRAIASAGNSTIASSASATATQGARRAVFMSREVYSARDRAANGRSDDHPRVGGRVALAVVADGEAGLDVAALREALEVLANRGQGLHEALEVVSREEEDRRRARCRDGRARRLVRQQRHLAEDVAGAQARERELAARGLVLRDLDLSR